MTKAPILVWIRRDLRLHDHAALSKAATAGVPVIPVFICDEAMHALGAAAKWRFGEGIAAFQKRLESLGSKLILRSGEALSVLSDLLLETGAKTVYWQRAYEPDQQAIDTAVKADLKAKGIVAESFQGHVLFEPWTVENKTGGFYKVYSPMWKAVKDRDVPAPLPEITKLPAPDVWPASEALEDWHLGRDMHRGADVLKHYARVGEENALDRLKWFIGTAVDGYKAKRDFPGVEATSRMSEPLTYGEISARTIWHEGQKALYEGAAGAEHFLKELVWREFAYHLLHHTPHILTQNWRPEWDSFPWQTADTPEVLAWKQGRTGVEFVDAAMRIGRSGKLGSQIV